MSRSKLRTPRAIQTARAVRKHWRNLLESGGDRVTVVLQPAEAAALRQLCAMFDREPKSSLLVRLLVRESIARGVLDPARYVDRQQTKPPALPAQPERVTLPPSPRTADDLPDPLDPVD